MVQLFTCRSLKYEEMCNCLPVGHYNMMDGANLCLPVGQYNMKNGANVYL